MSQTIIRTSGDKKGGEDKGFETWEYWNPVGGQLNI